jgi:hypothetical protein
VGSIRCVDSISEACVDSDRKTYVELRPVDSISRMRPS